MIVVIKVVKFINMIVVIKVINMIVKVINDDSGGN